MRTIFNLQPYGRLNLISSAILQHPQQNPAEHTATDNSALSHHPASFKARRIALDLSTEQLAAILGVAAGTIEMIETIPLGDEVSFLHNLTLSALELGVL